MIALPTLPLSTATALTPERAVPGNARRPANPETFPARERVAPEQVVQGEYLEREREPAQGFESRRVDQTLHREEHPAFHKRYANADYVQRQAVSAYQGHADVERQLEPQRGRIDYFV